jgi:hypothetical protein
MVQCACGTHRRSCCRWSVLLLSGVSVV